MKSIVLTGFESTGKSALFRNLTGQAVGDEVNFRGSTVTCRTCHSVACSCDIVDTPGVRLEGDSATTRLALATLTSADVILLVARGTDLQAEIEVLLRETASLGKQSALAITFADKAPKEIALLAEHYRRELGIPVVALNARELAPERRVDLLAAIAAATLPRTAQPLHILPAPTLLERKTFGPLLALAALLLMMLIPVMAAYWLAAWVQPLVDTSVITPMKAMLAGLPSWADALLTGSYGLLTLGWYSFLWALPVVLFLGVSTAVAEETGLVDRITRALDPAMRRVGLSGRDLLPYLTGFGCNVVAVMQSRACSSCTRTGCVSLITFGSACSYQIGATLSIFGASGNGSLFLPYLLLLALVGLVHTRVWEGKRSLIPLAPQRERAFLQAPSARAVLWRVKSVLRQFLLQAMPIFLLICVVAAGLEFFGLMTSLANAATPLMKLLGLPGETAPGVLFSILRKDGLLTLNQDGGALLAALTAGQIFLLVWLAGTLTACLVTLWTVRKEMGWRVAGKLAGRQALTSLATAGIISVIITP